MPQKTMHVLKNTGQSLYIKERHELLLQKSKKRERTNGESVLKQWQKQSYLVHDQFFKNRLQAEDITDEDMQVILENKETPASIHTSDWTDDFLKGVNLYCETVDTSTMKDNLGIAFQPFVAWSRHKLEEQLALFKEAHPLSYDHIVTSSLAALTEHLLQIGARAFTLELNVSRLRNELEGATPEDRFQSFVKRKLKDIDSLLEFYDEYITLARLLTVRTQFFTEMIVEATERFKRDEQQLQQTFSIKDTTIKEINIGLGDSHQNGKSVIEFTFSEDTSLIYKPKALSVTSQTIQLFEWFNKKGFSKPLSYHKVLDRLTYTWEEKVLPKECTTKQQISDYYYRFGGLVGIMYMLKGTDFHFENLIADGPYPMIIDFETLFQNHIQGAFKDTAEIRAKFNMADSALGTGLLPVIGFKGNDGAGIEMSALGGRSQELPFPVLQVENELTDEMKFVPKPLRTQEKANLPKLDGEYVDAADYVEDITKGFQQIMSIIRHSKEELLNQEGPLQGFHDVTIRHIVRNTNYYANFLLETNHPNFLRDALDREKVLDRIYFSNFPARIAAAEKADLIVGDIPYFTTTPSSTNLTDSHGNTYHDVFEESGMEKVRRKISNLTQKEVNNQVAWIHQAILSTKSKPTATKGTTPLPQTFAFTKNVMLQEAKQIADDLLEKAVWGPDNEEVTWHGIELNYRGQYGPAVLENGFYDGTGGIAFFFAYLGKVTGSNVYKQTAEAAMNSSLQKAQPYNAFLSAYYGPISLITPLLHFYELTQKERYLRHINVLVDYLKDKPSLEYNFDILGGSAGLIHSLINVYESQPEDKYLDIAVSYADHLCEKGVEEKQGIAWQNQTLAHKPKLGGFGHGAGGIATALLRIHQYRPKQQYKRTANKAWEFDNSLFDHRNRNWKDNRDTSGNTYGFYWCHGASGIGFSRLKMRKHVHREEIDQEVRLAINAIERSYASTNHSLCHGDMGIADFYLTAGQELKDQSLIEKAYEYTTNVIMEKEKNGYQSGVPHQLETPSLFLGMAGIGWELMRFAFPEDVPSLLL